MTTVPPFDYERAFSLEAGLAAVAAGAVPMHGGTELLPAMALGIMAPERVVSISDISELRVCHLDGERLILGSGLTHRDISRNQLVHAKAPVLVDVAAGIGNVRVRSTGTLGGNLAFAEPRSDLLIALLALDAEVLLAASAAQRTVPLANFLLGPYEVDIKPGELLMSVSLNVRNTGHAVYRKILRSERPIVGACLTQLDQGRWRLVVGAAAMTPTIVEVSELNDLDARAVAYGIDAIEDLGGSIAYKQHLAAVVIDRCRDAAAGLKGDRG